MKPNPSYSISSLFRALDLFDFLAERDDWTKFGAIQAGLKLSKSSTYSLLQTLLQRGCIYSDRAKGYKLDWDLYFLGQKVLNQSASKKIRTEAQTLVEKVAKASGENSFFGIINDNNKAAYIAKGTTPPNENAFGNVSDVGKRVPFQISGIGKALMAWRSDLQVQAIIAKNTPEKHTDKAILNPREYMKHLHVMRKHGFTVTNQEWVDSAVSVAAPVFIQGKKVPLGGVSIVCTIEKMRAGFFQKASETVYGAAKELSEKLGAADYPDFHPMPCPE